MDFDDLFDDDRYEENELYDINLSIKDDANKELLSLIYMEQLNHEQALISKKSETNGFSVERNFVNSKAFHDKFVREILPVNKEVSERLYQEAGRLLNFVDGCPQEYMLAIDARDGHLVVDNFKREGNSKNTSFNDDEMCLINCNKNNVIIMHNHSYLRPPSGKDICTFAEQDKVKLSIVVAHDGYVYAIISARKECLRIYNEALEEMKKITDNKEIQKTLATKYLYDQNEKYNRKLFIMEVL